VKMKAQLEEACMLRAATPCSPSALLHLQACLRFISSLNRVTVREDTHLISYQAPAARNCGDAYKLDSAQYSDNSVGTSTGSARFKLGSLGRGLFKTLCELWLCGRLYGSYHSPVASGRAASLRWGRMCVKGRE